MLLDVAMKASWPADDIAAASQAWTRLEQAMVHCSAELSAVLVERRKLKCEMSEGEIIEGEMNGK